MTSQDWVIVAVKLVFTVVAVLLMIFFVVLPILRTLRSKPDFFEFTPTFDRFEEEEEEIEIPTGDGKPDNRAIIDEARSKPRETAVLIQRWIREKK